MTVGRDWPADGTNFLFLFLLPQPLSTLNDGRSGPHHCSLQETRRPNALYRCLPTHTQIRRPRTGHCLLSWWRDDCWGSRELVPYLASQSVFSPRLCMHITLTQTGDSKMQSVWLQRASQLSPRTIGFSLPLQGTMSLTTSSTSLHFSLAPSNWVPSRLTVRAW